MSECWNERTECFGGGTPHLGIGSNLYVRKTKLSMPKAQKYFFFLVNVQLGPRVLLSSSPPTHCGNEKEGEENIRVLHRIKSWSFLEYLGYRTGCDSTVCFRSDVIRREEKSDSVKFSFFKKHQPEESLSREVLDMWYKKILLLKKKFLQWYHHLGHCK